MAFPLVTVLTAAPGLIAAAADILRLVKQRKQGAEVPPDPEQVPPWPGMQQLDELSELVEKQAGIIEDLAVNNSKLVLAIRNNRIISIVSMVIALISLLVALLS